MFYSLALLAFGIYLGQELNLPSVKILALTLFNKTTTNQEKQDQLTTNTYYNWVVNYFVNKQKE